MILLAAGCSYKNTLVEVRERLGFKADQLPRALEALTTTFDGEAVVLSTCNRVELYLSQGTDPRLTGSAAPADRPTISAAAALTAEGVVRFLADFHGMPAEAIQLHLYVHTQAAAVRHLFRVAGSLDSMIVGEGQISG